MERSPDILALFADRRKHHIATRYVFLVIAGGSTKLYRTVANPQCFPFSLNLKWCHLLKITQGISFLALSSVEFHPNFLLPCHFFNNFKCNVNRYFTSSRNLFFHCPFHQISQKSSSLSRPANPCDLVTLSPCLGKK